MFTTLLQQTPILQLDTGAATAPASQAATTAAAQATTQAATAAAEQGLPVGPIVIAALIAAVVFGWFGLRYWLAVTRPAAIKEIETPNINRMNAAALDHMVGESAEEAEAELEAMRHETAPDDLLAAIPPEEVEVKEPPMKAEGEKKA
jgi:hypothetical protein